MQPDGRRMLDPTGVPGCIGATPAPAPATRLRGSDTTSRPRNGPTPWTKSAGGVRPAGARRSRCAPSGKPLRRRVAGALWPWNVPRGRGSSARRGHAKRSGGSRGPDDANLPSKEADATRPRLDFAGPAGGPAQM